MSGEYRDELAAAHARIAELEDKLRAATEEPAGKPRSEGRFPELEARVAELRKATDEVAYNRRRTALSILGSVFPLGAGLFSYAYLPVPAAVCSIVFIMFIAYNAFLARRLKTAKKELVEAEAKLGGALRIADLEEQLAARKVRVAPEPEEESGDERDHEDDEKEAEPQRMAR